MSLILFLLTWHPLPPGAPPRFQTADLVFDQVQTEWVAGTEHRLRLARRTPFLNAGLGHRKCDVRDATEWIVGRLGDRVLNQLTVATLSGDPEIQRRAERLVRSAFLCAACEGTGVCPKCHGGEEDEPSYGPEPPPRLDCDCNWRSDCGSCYGSGDLRYVYDKTLHDEHGPQVIFKPRNLFGGKADHEPVRN